MCPPALAIVLLLAAQAAESTPPASSSSLTLQAALDLARASNPTLLAARLRAPVNAAGLAVAREWPNPELRYERAKETPRDALGVAQLLEIGGKRGRRIAVAEATVRTGEAELAQTEAEVLADVRRAFFVLAGVQRRLAASQELKDLASRASGVARDRYEVGDVSRLDVLQAQLAFDQADNEVVALAGELRAARVELNALIGHPMSAETAVLDEVDRAMVPDPVQAAEAAVVTNAALTVLDRQVAEAEARGALARAQRIPDPTVEATVTHGADPEFDWGYRAAVGISLPLFTRHSGQVRVEETTASLLRAQREALAQRIRGVAAAAAARAAAHSDQYRRYRDAVLPQSREVESLAEEAYRSGQTNLVAFLLTVQAAREVRARAVQSAADYESALADLQRAMSAGPR